MGAGWHEGLCALRLPTLVALRPRLLDAAKLAECKTLAKKKRAHIHCAALGYSAMASNHDDKPRFVEPRRALVKAMARRAKTSHLGSFQILPEHVLLSCLAQLPRADHDAVADCSRGPRRRRRLLDRLSSNYEK